MSEQQLDRVKRIGVFGGTFDPPHVGHLAAAEHVRQVHHLDQVIFVPVGKPPHKASDRLTSARHRYLMTVLATLENPHFTVSRVEIDRRGISYTVDTLRQLRAEFGEENEYFFLIGYDALNAFHTWREPEQILQMCRLIALAGRGTRSMSCLRSSARSIRIFETESSLRKCLNSMSRPVKFVSKSRKGLPFDTESMNWC